MGDDQHGSLARDGCHIGLDYRLAFVIECRSGFIQNEDTGIEGERACNRDALALAAGQARAAFADHRLIALRSERMKSWAPASRAAAIT